MTYEERKLAGICTYPGCPEPAEDDCLLCAAHRAKAKERAGRWLKQQRKRWRKRGRCSRCGRKRASGSWACARCLVELGRARRPDVDKHVDKQSARTRLITEGDGRTRIRYIGQGKRGARSVAANDASDLGDILRYTTKCRDALAFLAAQPDLGRQQRKEARAAALSFLHYAVRLGNEMLERNHYETPKAEESDT